MGSLPVVVASFFAWVTPPGAATGAERQEPTAVEAADAPPSSDAPSAAEEQDPFLVAPLLDREPALMQPTATTEPATTVAAAHVTPPRLPRETHGLGLSAGFGFVYGGIGLQARYDLPIRPWLIVSPFASAGLFYGLHGPAGVSTALGSRHRLAVDLAVGPLGRRFFTLHGTTVDERTLYGPIVAVGYEHMTGRGWFQRTTIEYGYETWGLSVPIADPHRFLVGFGFGRRIW